MSIILPTLSASNNALSLTDLGDLTGLGDLAGLSVFDAKTTALAELRAESRVVRARIEQLHAENPGTPAAPEVLRVYHVASIRSCTCDCRSYERRGPSNPCGCCRRHDTLQRENDPYPDNKIDLFRNYLY